MEYIRLVMVQIKIFLLFSVLAILLVFLGGLIGYVFGDILLFTTIFLILAIGLNLYSYFYSDKLALRMTKSKLVTESEEPRLYRIVKKVVSTVNISMPKVGVMETQIPNAFATGRDEKHSVVVVTRGILNMLDDDELESVIGHEVGHITNRDILISTIAATIATMISYIGNLVLFSELFGGEQRNNNAGILLLVAAILIPIGAVFVQLGISRSRESNADITSVRTVRKPDAMISALRKISSVKAPPAFGMGSRRRGENIGAFSSLFIVNNFSAHSLMNLLSTHPTLEKRIADISKEREKLGI
ncbi:MAG: M48 family metalloprotease [Candidatus Parvarchaeota archaeon]